MSAEPKIGKNTGNAGKGRPKGATNKNTAQLKDMILAALSNAGGIDYLEARALDQPAAFMTLVGKVLPLQVSGTGDEGQHIFEHRRTIVDPRHSADSAGIPAVPATGEI